MVDAVLPENLTRFKTRQSVGHRGIGPVSTLQTTRAAYIDVTNVQTHRQEDNTHEGMDK